MAVQIVVGAVLALGVAEVALRPFATGLGNDWLYWQSVPVVADSEYGPRIELRQYHEGIATSHFSLAHARLTGNVFLPGAPVGVVLGDSYVEALQVSDSQTTGAVVERASRQAGMPLNVRQYGWSGAGVPQYVDIARDILDRWDPRWVAVELNEGDLQGIENASSDAGLPKLPPAQTYGTRAYAAAARAPKSTVRIVREFAVSHSVVAYQVLLRWREIVGKGARGDTDGGERSANAAANNGLRRVVRTLREAYGSRLVVVYVATVGARVNDPDPQGTALLAACQAEGVACASTRDDMRRVLYEHAQFARGFSNGPPAAGHPNAIGHQIMAEELWRMVGPEATTTLAGTVRTKVDSLPRPRTAPAGAGSLSQSPVGAHP